MSTLREKRKKERRALRRRKTADWTVVLILCAIAVCCGGYLIYHHWSVKQRELEYEKLRQEETLSAATETVIAEPETEESTEETVIYCDRSMISDSCMNRMKIFTHGSLCRERR